MTSDTLTFSGDDSAPLGSPIPSADELRMIGELGTKLHRGGRVTLMNQICGYLGIPPGGWQGQAKLFEGNDIRLRWLMLKLAKPRYAALVADNVARAARYVDINLLLTIVSAARESDASLSAKGTEMIETFRSGGLDYLWEQKPNLGLPSSVTSRWKEQERYPSRETGHYVHPAWIPANDQLLAYAAQVSASFTNQLKSNLLTEFGDPATQLLSGASRSAVLVWQVFAFLRPGGKPYQPKVPTKAQLDTYFGHRTALQLYAHTAKAAGRRPSVDDVLSDHSLDRLENFRSAKTRAAETLFLERLLKRVRELSPQ